jgi:ferrochelatase
MPSSGVAVLLSCHGTVERVADMGAFVQNIRRGRPAPEEVVAEVTRRFERIGGSPLMRITREQAEKLEDRLQLPVRAAARLWHPYPKEVLSELVAQGIERVVSLPLAPQSVHVYNAAVERAASSFSRLRIAAAEPYGHALVDAFVEAIGETQGHGALVLTAHSLPRAVVDAGDPYERDFRAMAAAVEARVKERFDKVHVAFQSKGMDGGAWLEPDLDDVLSEIATSGTRDVIIAPIGFLADHVETLYDIDIAVAQRAHELGFERFQRMPAMNTRPRFLDALEGVARALIDRLS